MKDYSNSILNNRTTENEYIEYKKSVEQKDKILKTVCAYANNYMDNEVGLIFIGVEETNDPITGEKATPVLPIIGIPKGKIETTENHIRSLLGNGHIAPKPDYEILSCEIDSKDYLLIAVMPGNKGPYQTTEKAYKDCKLKAGYYIRKSRDTTLTTKQEELQLLSKFSEMSFSSSSNRIATLDDLDYEYMKEYLVKTGSDKELINMSKEDIAKSLGLISFSTIDGKYQAKNFAVLMFCNSPEEFIPGAFCRVVYEIDHDTSKMGHIEFRGPIWIQAIRLRDYLESDIVRSYTLRNGSPLHQVVYNWPPKAIKEIATNCIVHKDYQKNEIIEIQYLNDTLSFINHNRPLPPVTIKDLNSSNNFFKRSYLNREIIDMFSKLSLIETYGSGIRMARHELKKNGSQALVYDEGGDNFDYTLAEIKICPEFETVRKNYAQPSSTQEILDLPEKQKSVYLAIMNNPGIRRLDLVEKTGQSEDSIKRAITSLSKRGLIALKDDKRRNGYTIKQKV